MSKVWFVVVALGVLGGVAWGKDKNKGNDAPRATRGAAPRASSSERKSESAPRPAPVPKSASAPKPAPAPVQKSAPAPKASSAPTPASRSSQSAPSSSRSTQSFGRVESAFRKSEARAAQPTPTTPKAVTNSAPASNVAPAGKIGKATGSTPIESPKVRQPDADKRSNSAAEHHADHKHSTNKSASRGSTGTSSLPTPPKFATNGKIPPFGSSLANMPKPTKDTHDHDHKPAAPARLPVSTSNNNNPAHKDHDHDRDQHYAGSRRDNDRHDHHDDRRLHNHGHSHRSGRSSLSWLFIGGSSLGRCSYGYGCNVGPGYYGPTYVYTPPTEVYVSTPIVTSSSVETFVAPPQQQMSPDEFAALPIERQRELLLQALNAFEEDLTRSPNGDDWSRHLQLATIAKLVTEGDQRPDATLRARLRSVVQLFDEVAANSDYQAVSELATFRVLHLGLHEYAAEEIDRSRRQLSQSASTFSTGLNAWTSGERWREYLQLAWLIGTDEEMQIDLEARLARFETLLAKFDRVKSDDQFRVVTQPREFGQVHAALHRFVEHLRGLVMEARNAEPRSPEGELSLPAEPR